MADARIGIATTVTLLVGWLTLTIFGVVYQSDALRWTAVGLCFAAFVLVLIGWLHQRHTLG